MRPLAKRGNDEEPPCKKGDCEEWHRLMREITSTSEAREVTLMLARALSTIRYEATGALANYLSPDHNHKGSLIRIECCARDALESLQKAAQPSAREIVGANLMQALREQHAEDEAKRNAAPQASRSKQMPELAPQSGDRPAVAAPDIAKDEVVALLAVEAFEKQEHLRIVGTANTPTDYEARKKAAVEYALALYEASEAAKKLDAAIRGIA